MPSRFDRYRIKDGVSKLGEKTFNPIFQDIDLRMSSLETLRISWEQAVDAITQFGLLRINQTLAPAYEEIIENGVTIETARQTAVAALEELQSALANVETDAIADLDAWKAARLAELEAWQAGLSGEIPGINGRLDALEALIIIKLAYANRASLRALTPADGNLSIVEGLGLFQFYDGSDEPDDDESCFATASGRWLLDAAHWDLIDAWQLADDDARDVYLDDIAGRWPGRVLFGTAVYAGGTVLTVSQAAFTGAITGAAVGDMVVATPPDALVAQVAFFARVTGANTVTVYINNPSAGSAIVPAGTWQLAVFKTS